MSSNVERNLGRKDPALEGELTMILAWPFKGECDIDVPCCSDNSVSFILSTLMSFGSLFNKIYYRKWKSLWTGLRDGLIHGCKDLIGISLVLYSLDRIIVASSFARVYDFSSHRVFAQQWFQVWFSSCGAALKSNHELVDNFSNVHDTITLLTGKSCQDKIHCSSEASRLGKSGDDLSPPMLCIAPSSTES